MRVGLPLFALACLLGGCATPPEAPPAPPEAPAVTIETPPAEPVAEPPPAPVPKPGAAGLAKGIEAYENGQYRAARNQLSGALESGLDAPDQVTAHKYLAFIACASGQRITCRSHFKKALDIDAGFSLTRTESGHPIWGKIFREVKAERSKAKR